MSNLHRLEQTTNVHLTGLLVVLTNSRETPTASLSTSQTNTSEQEAALRAAGSFVDEMPPAAERGSTLALHRTTELLATAGLLRQYFPKDADLSRWSAEDLEAVALTINNRPRKTLGCRTPAVVFAEQPRSLPQAGVATTS